MSVRSSAGAGHGHPYVEQRPDVQGGRPVIRGSRFPVSSIVQNHRRGLSVDEILQEFPHLQPAEVYDALSFYYDHQTDIDQELDELASRSAG
jgi:uncharacterized protein (DUF433 family)